MFADAKVIKLHLAFQPTVNSTTAPLNKKSLSYPLPPSIIENTIRHNITQMISARNSYILCPLAIIIKSYEMKGKVRL